MLSDKELERLRASASLRGGKWLQLLAEHAELKREAGLLRAYWDSECADHAYRRCAEWCSHCRANAVAVRAVQNFDAARASASLSPYTIKPSPGAPSLFDVWRGEQLVTHSCASRQEAEGEVRRLSASASAAGGREDGDGK